jgi:hypothetical protein
MSDDTPKGIDSVSVSDPTRRISGAKAGNCGAVFAFVTAVVALIILITVKQAI